jgi:opacity protein-like surface antigen
MFGPSCASAADTADVYLSLSLVVGLPDNRGLTIGGQDAKKVTLHDSLGAGLKIGVFPRFTHRIVGVELEYFGATGRLSALTAGSNGGAATSGLTVTNSMTNLVVRKPGGTFHPYVGFGIGYASGLFHGADFPGRANKDFDSTAAFAYQVIAGLQYHVGARTFLFSEYKRLTADFHWNDASLDYHAQYVLVGVGWSF